jgi:hypothetical protein
MPGSGRRGLRRRCVPRFLCRATSPAPWRLLDPAVAQLDGVLFLKLFVEVLDVQVEVLLPIQRQNPLSCIHCNAQNTSLPAPLIE